MAASLHHVHLFCRDIDATVAWWRDMLGARVAVDEELAGSRNVFLEVGDGRLHLYDQPPPGGGRNAVHHLGIRSHDLPTLVEHMKAKGVAFRSGIREHGAWRYIMAEAPDGVLLELFAFDTDKLTGDLRRYFGE
jgi:catechol 2,3-dioxygenase-like lactoylglutathione lyase family enzyme